MTQNSKHIVFSPPLSYILSVFLLNRKETKYFFKTGLKNYRKKGIQKQIFESNISSHFQCSVAFVDRLSPRKRNRKENVFCLGQDKLSREKDQMENELPGDFKDK